MIELSGMIIEVKTEDIREAKRVRQEFEERKVTTYSRADSCPLAIALKRTFPNYRFIVGVVMPYITFERQFFYPHDCRANQCNPHHRETIKLSEKAEQFVYETDKKKDRIKAQTVRL